MNEKKEDGAELPHDVRDGKPPLAGHILYRNEKEEPDAERHGFLEHEPAPELKKRFLHLPLRTPGGREHCFHPALFHKEAHAEDYEANDFAHGRRNRRTGNAEFRERPEAEDENGVQPAIG